MNIHYLQHVPFENPGSILEWAEQKSHITTATHVYRGDPFPDPDAFDMLIIMGPGEPTVSSAAQTHASESRIREVNAGFFLQETVGFNDRLFLIGGLRMDGSSTFGQDYGFQYYPKLSASYVISDESFWSVGW